MNARPNGLTAVRIEWDGAGGRRLLRSGAASQLSCMRLALIIDVSRCSKDAVDKSSEFTHNFCEFYLLTNSSKFNKQ